MSLSPARAAIAALGLVGASSAIASLASSPEFALATSGLAWPGFAPPDWIAAPLRAVLSGATAVALWRALRLPASPARRSALIAFGGMLALAALQPIAFFVMQSPALGLFVMLGQFALALLAAMRLAILDRTAGALMTPTLVWLLYALAVTAGIVMLN